MIVSDITTVIFNIERYNKREDMFISWYRFNSQIEPLDICTLGKARRTNCLPGWTQNLASGTNIRIIHATIDRSFNLKAYII